MIIAILIGVFLLGGAAYADDKALDVVTMQDQYGFNYSMIATGKTNLRKPDAEVRSKVGDWPAWQDSLCKYYLLGAAYMTRPVFVGGDSCLSCHRPDRTLKGGEGEIK